MAKHVYTDEEIQQRYLDDLQAEIEKDFKEDEAACIAEGFPGEAYSALKDMFSKGKYSWPMVNVFEFECSKHQLITERELQFFKSSDVVWSIPWVDARDNKLIVVVVLIDHYEGE